MAESVRNEQGAEVCTRVKEVAIENVPKDPSKGFHYEKRYCNRPLTLSIAEKRKICPDCERPAPVGNVQPRVTNAAGISLTAKELEECGVKDGQDPSLKAPVVRKTIEAPQAVEAKVEVKKDVVNLNVPLEELESNGDVAAYLVKKVLEGFGSLPVTNYAESKRLMKLEEKLEALLRA